MKREPMDVETVIEQLGRWRHAAERSDRRDGEADYWRRRLERLEREAIKRRAAGDTDWFFWLTEYASMVSATLHERFDSLYSEGLLRVARARLNRKAGAVKAAAARREQGKKKAERVLAGETGIVSGRHARRILKQRRTNRY